VTRKLPRRKKEKRKTKKTKKTKTGKKFDSSSSSEEQTDKQEKRKSVPRKISPKPKELEASKSSSVSSETDSSSSSGRISRKTKPTFTLFKQSSTSSSEEQTDKQTRRKSVSRKRSPKSKPKYPNYGLFDKEGDKEAPETKEAKKNDKIVVIEEDIFVKKMPKKSTRKIPQSSISDVSPKSKPKYLNYGLFDKEGDKEAPETKEVKSSISDVSSEEKSNNLNYGLFFKGGDKEDSEKKKGKPQKEKTSSSSDEQTDKQARTKSKSNKISDNEDSEELERAVQARLEITDLPPENIGEDPKQDVKMDIVVDPDKENPMYVGVQAGVSDKEMNVLAKAANEEGEGKAEVRGEIQKGTAKDEDKVVLEVVEDATDSDEMNLKVGNKKEKSGCSHQ